MIGLLAAATDSHQAWTRSSCPGQAPQLAGLMIPRQFGAERPEIQLAPLSCGSCGVSPDGPSPGRWLRRLWSSGDAKGRNH